MLGERLERVLVAGIFAHGLRAAGGVGVVLGVREQRAALLLRPLQFRDLLLELPDPVPERGIVAATPARLGFAALALLFLGTAAPLAILRVCFMVMSSRCDRIPDRSLAANLPISYGAA